MGWGGGRVWGRVGLDMVGLNKGWCRSRAGQGRVG